MDRMHAAYTELSGIAGTDGERIPVTGWTAWAPFSIYGRLCGRLQVNREGG